MYGLFKATSRRQREEERVASQSWDLWRADSVVCTTRGHGLLPVLWGKGAPWGFSSSERNHSPWAGPNLSSHNLLSVLLATYWTTQTCLGRYGSVLGHLTFEETTALGLNWTCRYALSMSSIPSWAWIVSLRAVPTPSSPGVDKQPSEYIRRCWIILGPLKKGSCKWGVG